MEVDPPSTHAIDVAIQFIEEQLALWDEPRALVLGISGPQGSGKSYLTAQILEYLHQSKPNLNCVGVLLDDFYLTRLDQQIVTERAQQSGNSLLVGRGLPGTHDLELMMQTIQKLRDGNVPVSIPVYDKSAFNGLGDRLPEWRQIEHKVDVVVFEGWMNGYKAIDEVLFPAAYLSCGTESVVQRTKMYHLLRINADLASYERIWNLFDKFIYLSTNNEKNVYTWRLQQETALIAQKGTGMTSEQVIRFVDRYMPMYVLYYWRMCNKGAAPKGCNKCIEIDGERRVIGQKTF